MEALVLLFILFIFCFAWFLENVRGNGKSQHTPSHHVTLGPSNERLPNGYTRSDYRNYGMTDFDIEFWGLDQPGAPEPPMAGWMIWDMLDGELDGEIDF